MPTGMALPHPLWPGMQGSERARCMSRACKEQPTLTAHPAEYAPCFPAPKLKQACPLR